MNNYTRVPLILEKRNNSWQNKWRSKKNYQSCKINTRRTNNLEDKITFKEAGGALKNVKNDKTPGSDGYSAEFFLFLWKDLQIFIVNSLNYGYDIGELSVTHKARYNNLSSSSSWRIGDQYLFWILYIK